MIGRLEGRRSRERKEEGKEAVSKRRVDQYLQYVSLLFPVYSSFALFYQERRRWNKRERRKSLYEGDDVNIELKTNWNISSSNLLLNINDINTFIIPFSVIMIVTIMRMIWCVGIDDGEDMLEGFDEKERNYYNQISLIYLIIIINHRFIRGITVCSNLGQLILGKLRYIIWKLLYPFWLFGKLS